MRIALTATDADILHGIEEEVGPRLARELHPQSGNHVIRKALLCGLLQQLQMIQVLDTPNRNVFTCRHFVAHEVLKNDANLMIKVFQVILVQIDTIEQNLSFGRIVQARQQLDDRCLALAVLSNQSDPLPWVKMKIQVLDHHPHASWIPE